MVQDDNQDREWFRMTSGQEVVQDDNQDREWSLQDDNQDREWFRMTIRTGSGSG